jgi:hypothetical protein
MPERTAMLASAMITTALVAALFAQSSRSLRAEEECTSKPNAPAPQGQHWYYRTDHANNRQCWRLGLQGLPVQKSAPQTEKQSAADPAAPSVAPLRVPQRETTGASLTEIAKDTSAFASTAPTPWPDASKSLDVQSFVQRVPQPAPMAEPQSASAIDSTPAANRRSSDDVSDPSPPLSADASASVSDALPRDTGAREPQTRATARSAVAAAPIQAIAEVDHTFALLMVVFAVLAVTGPIHHYTERRRRRESSSFHVPEWARVVALNAPKPRARLPFAMETRTGKRLAPSEVRLPDQTEKLAQVLQQLVDRMQMDRRQAAGTVSASGGHLRDQISPARQQAGAR